MVLDTYLRCINIYNLNRINYTKKIVSFRNVVLKSIKIIMGQAETKEGKRSSLGSNQSPISPQAAHHPHDQVCLHFCYFCLLFCCLFTFLAVCLIYILFAFSREPVHQLHHWWIVWTEPNNNVHEEPVMKIP